MTTSYGASSLFCWLRATMGGASATHKQMTRWAASLDRHLISPLQAEPLSYFIGGRDLERKLLQDAPNLFHLFCTGASQHALSQIETVFETNTDVAAQKRRQRGDPHLVPSCAE